MSKLYHCSQCKRLLQEVEARLETEEPMTDEEGRAWLESKKYDPSNVCAFRLRDRHSTYHSESPHPLLQACESGTHKLIEWLLAQPGASNMVSTPSNHHWRPLSRLAFHFLHIFTLKHNCFFLYIMAILISLRTVSMSFPPFF